jgi:hypothetical protein
VTPPPVPGNGARRGSPCEITYVTRGRRHQRAAAIVPAELVERYEEMIDREDGRIAAERLADIEAGHATTVSGAEVTRALEQ